MTPEQSARLVELLPHRGAALLVHEVLHADATSLTCRGRIPAASAYASSGTLSSLLAVEVAAQAVGLHEAFLRGQLAEADAQAGVRGYLVGLKEVELQCEHVLTDADLDARVQRISASPPLSAYEIVVRSAGAQVLRGVITTYLDRR